MALNTFGIDSSFLNDTNKVSIDDIIKSDNVFQTDIKDTSFDIKIDENIEKSIEKEKKNKIYEEAIRKAKEEANNLINNINSEANKSVKSSIANVNTAAANEALSKDDNFKEAAEMINNSTKSLTGDINLSSATGNLLDVLCNGIKFDSNTSLPDFPSFSGFSSFPDIDFNMPDLSFLINDLDLDPDLKLNLNILDHISKLNIDLDISISEFLSKLDLTSTSDKFTLDFISKLKDYLKLNPSATLRDFTFDLLSNIDISMPNFDFSSVLSLPSMSSFLDLSFCGSKDGDKGKTLGTNISKVSKRVLHRDAKKLVSSAVSNKNISVDEVNDVIEKQDEDIKKEIVSGIVNNAKININGKIKNSDKLAELVNKNISYNDIYKNIKKKMKNEETNLMKIAKSAFKKVKKKEGNKIKTSVELAAKSYFSKYANIKKPKLKIS